MNTNQNKDVMPDVESEEFVQLPALNSYTIELQIGTVSKGEVALIESEAAPTTGQ